ncbi:sensor histidine kinase [Shewanella surugensis]|uniref:histidine kinase n=1 Tax=Shewanella surugensis TaxID=212020 RepID=A0ABT0L6G3_9GAMM|nr:ATP-binding protein [Shewanella surugensis]MCL1123266.1 ATP-binding protein [Shewanella surugensis]
MSVWISLLSLGAALLFMRYFGSSSLLWSFLLSALITFVASVYVTRHLSQSLKALEVGLLNFKDNDFSVSLPVGKEEPFQTLSKLFNHASDSLRQERQFIYQRELLLDKVIQSSPNVMLLFDDNHKIIYANDAARHLFYRGRPIIGLSLSLLLDRMPRVLCEAINDMQEGLFSWQSDKAHKNDIETMETWHVSRGRFLLNGQNHHLLLLKQMTRELDRQEVLVWKKVIRIISHELNNSVAPITSMVHSGKMITKEMNNSRLNLIFDTIADRSQHLSQFIADYSRFAKLSLPQKEAVDWDSFTAQLTQHYYYELASALPKTTDFFDVIQMEQVLINLLKNAHESGSKPDAIQLLINTGLSIEGQAGIEMIIQDKGDGMSSEVLKQALLPFYSTKQSGTGIGLPLCREIIEAHNGLLSMHNRPHGGLRVKLWLPKR